jgi:uncharacterized membrane protein
VGFLTVLVAIAACGLAIKVWIDTAARRRDLDERLAVLTARIAGLEARLPRLSPPAAAAPEPTPEPAPAAEPEPIAARMAGIPRVPSPPAVAPVPAGLGMAALEDRLMRHWLVWLGALALALGAVFLVRYSIERGFFGPLARIVSGVVVGLALLVAGEWTRRHPPSPWPGIGMPPDHVPPALSAAGIVALFASIYAADALYALVPPLVAFVLLAAVSAAAALLSLQHGRFMALLGFVGAYVVPALVATPHPTAAGLLVYVLLVTAGALLLERWHGWAPLGWVIAAGAMVWGGLALVLHDRALPLGLYLLVVPALFVLLVPADRAAPRRPGFVWAAAAADALLMVALVIVQANDAPSLALAGALALLLAGLGVRDPGYDRLAWIGGAGAVLVLAGWEFTSALPATEPSSYFLVAPPSVLRAYLGAALLAALVAGSGGAILMDRAPRPARWAFLAAATPVAIMIVAYWRAERFEASLPWSGIALALTAANVFAAERIRARPAPIPAALAAHAVAAIAALSLGFTMGLRLGWVTVALSLQLPALVWVFDRTGVRAVRVTALVLAAIVLVRLLLNPSVADYEIGDRPIFNALLYTYGVPWLAFLASTRGFRRSARDALVLLLESGTIALFVALVSLEIRHLLNGTIASPRYDLLEQGLHTSAWLAIAYAMLPRAPGPEPVVRQYAWRILLAAACVNLVLFSLAQSNPLLMRAPVGTRPIFDSLLFAYLIPGLFAALFHRAFRRLGLEVAASVAGIAALALGFIYLSFEVRHLFRGAILLAGAASDAEWYAYSAVWLAYGLGLLLAGLLLGHREVRLAGLAVGAIVACKVFLFDMAALSGLLRAASFLGLGATFIGLGYLYQRLSGATRAKQA